MSARNGSAPLDGIFVLPVLDRCLVYAPLCNFAALVDRVAVERIRDGLRNAKGTRIGSLAGIVDTLRSATRLAPLPRQGRLEPAFLGLITTRRCNLACEYCGFPTADEAGGAMDLRLAREAVAWYLDLVRQSGDQTAVIEFFGGEPFCAEEVIDFVFHFARLKAAEIGCTVRLGVVTNGTFSEERCRWAADSLDSVVLSLDGPVDIQDGYRHRKDGQGSFAVVARSAAILSEGAAEFSLRTCVTDETVDRMPEIAAWFCQDYRPASVCFEPVQLTPQSKAAGLSPPDPWAFAWNFIQAARILEAYEVKPVYAAADIAARQVSSCPVGRDVVIVSPDGAVSACYLLKRDWEAKGLDLCLGKLGNGTPDLDVGALEAVRNLNVWNKPFCARCFCKWHCAGGCHVNHGLPDTPGAYDSVCIQTRVITLRNILKAMDCDNFASCLLDSPQALERAVWQVSDSLADFEGQP
jgi:uncharacterized protein